jgi:hypothetical protein
MIAFASYVEDSSEDFSQSFASWLKVSLLWCDLQLYSYHLIDKNGNREVSGDFE